MPHMAPIVLASIIGGGAAATGSIAAAKIGSGAAKNATVTQQQIANDAIARSKPAYDQAYSYYSGLLKGGPQLQASLAPAVNATTMQFDQARKNMVAGAYSRGGALDKGLRNLEAGKAYSLADLYGKAQGAGASGLAALAGADTTAAANLLAGANQASAYQSLIKGQALEGLGGIFTRLLSTPGLFGGGGSSYTPPPAAPGTPAAVIGLPGNILGSYGPSFTKAGM